ncbi:MAG: PadR family transcriptional regulator [Candidatus Heimdallarchaeota archaeon]|nr:PadR family transcriptional regulator [Candidatus Heimdallarchaeota archaeon]
MIPFFSPTKILDNIILVHLVMEGPLHGYGLASSIEVKMGWKPSQTSIYNSLKSMESENLVTVEENIEKGRVQRIYSITDKGREVYNETKEMMRKHMVNNLSQFFSFVQMLSEMANKEESEIIQQYLQTIIESMQGINRLVFLLVREAPEEVNELLKSTFTSLIRIAKKHDIQVKDEET